MTAVFRPCQVSFGRYCLLLLAAFLLAACGTTAPHKGAEEGAASGAAPTQGGAYYKDDGPHAVPPSNLDAVPDAEPRLEPLHRYANRPYKVMGKAYVPATELRPFREQGQASWYGRRFHGKPTSSGEPYDMYAMTAAHPTLPIPSYVRVTNVGNRRTVVVRINDRGPFLKGRVIDLSYVAAHKLGYINAGSAQVDVEQILPQLVAPRTAAGLATAPAPALGAAAAVASAVAAGEEDDRIAARTVAPLPVQAPALQPGGGDESVAGGELLPQLASASGGIFLQLGAFSSLTNAAGLKASLEREADITPAQRIELLADGERYRLHAGPYENLDAARAAAEELGLRLQLKPFVVIR